MLGIPASTPFDLRFRLLGIPVRVHPFFWLVALMIAWDEASPAITMIGVGCVFLSILVHELGHGLTARVFRDRPAIVLHGMGGLCTSDGEDRGFARRLLVLAMGPGAGLGLAVAAFALLIGLTVAGVSIGPAAGAALTTLVTINVLWTLLNLLPVWPLDGGQIVQLVLERFGPRHGARRGHMVSCLVAAAAAAAAVLWFPDLFLFPAILLGYLAAVNYLLLTHHHRLALADREAD